MTNKYQYQELIPSLQEITMAARQNKSYKDKKWYINQFVMYVYNNLYDLNSHWNKQILKRAKKGKGKITIKGPMHNCLTCSFFFIFRRTKEKMWYYADINEDITNKKLKKVCRQFDGKFKSIYIKEDSYDKLIIRWL